MRIVRKNRLDAPPPVELAYSTSFGTAENPLSEGGLWTNGRVATDWKNCKVVGGLCYGVDGAPDQSVDDPTAILTGMGAWAADQKVTATVKTVNQNGSVFQEVEIRLRTTISASSIAGYEINYRCLSDAYCEIVRWNGAIGDFTYVSQKDTTHDGIPGLADGDIFEAQIVGATITVRLNGVTVNSGTDATFATGYPGLGFYQPNGNTGDYGFTHWAAVEL